MMKFLFAFIAVFLFYSPVHAAVTPNDFYCMEFTESTTTFTKSVFKNCKAGMEEKEGICSETVRCIPLKGGFKAALRAKYPGKDIFNLTEDEKRAYFKDVAASNWIPTTLTCKGVKEEDMTPVCPLPDQCKGDMFFGVEGADFDKTKQEYKDIMGRLPKFPGDSGTSHSFPVNQKPVQDERVQEAKP